MYVNHIKTYYVRLENHKEVPCEWNYVSKSSIDARSKDQNKFKVIPNSGILASKQKAVIEIVFMPNSEKIFNAKLTFKIKDNPGTKLITVKGQGLEYKFELDQQSITLGPIIPYNDQIK